MSINYAKLNLSLIHGKISSTPEEANLRQKALDLWFPSWTETYQSVGSTFIPRTDDFLRQDAMHMITYESDVIAILFYSFYDLGCLANLQHSYMSFFDDVYLQKLYSLNVSRVMSIEFLTIDKKFRFKNIHLRLGQILFRCSHEVLKLSNAQAITAMARKDVSASSMLQEVGYNTIQKNIVKRNFSCDSLIFMPGNTIELQGDELKVFQMLWKEQYISDVIKNGYPFKKTDHYKVAA